MPDHFTTRLQLPYPDIDDPADVPADMQQLAERLDVLIPASSGAGLVLNRAAVLDVGMAGQVRAGRQLALADFTAMGLAAPVGLWNLSDLTDASGNARALTNKGAVTFAPGINGAAATAAQFTGSTAQALYIMDVGSADPFRIRMGSWGCWFRTAKRGVTQQLIGKSGTAAGYYLWDLQVSVGNTLAGWVSSDGTAVSTCGSATDVADDRWHHGVLVHDGTMLRLYVDGNLEGQLNIAHLIYNGQAVPFNIGGLGGDAATATLQPTFGRVDEAFVTADVLSDEQVRNLYCARLPHGYGVVPSSARVNVVRRRRGGAFIASDFPVQPLRLYNFAGGILNDEGSNNVPLTNGATYNAPGADGARLHARGYTASDSGDYSTDAGLPQGTGSRSYGCWFKVGAAPGASVGLVSWGTLNTGDCRLWLYIDGKLYAQNGGDTMNGGVVVCDGAWHLAVAVEDNAAADGIKRKLYLDGRVVGGSTGLVAVVLAGATRFRVGAFPDGTGLLTGQVDGVFVTDVALTTGQVLALWAKGSQALTPSPVTAGDFVEAWDAASVLATFDVLDSNWQVDLGVAA